MGYKLSGQNNSNNESISFENDNVVDENLDCFKYLNLTHYLQLIIFRGSKPHRHFSNVWGVYWSKNKDILVFYGYFSDGQ